MSKKQKKVTISSWSIFIFLGYTISILICDYIDLVCYLAGIQQATIYSRILMLIFFGVLCVWGKNKVDVNHQRTDLLFKVFAVLIFAFGILKGIVPDTSCDVYNYHLLAQTPGFLDAFTYHVAPGDFQLFGFPLADRMFFLFRQVLGYRMGTQLNTLVILLIYFQVYSLLKDLFGERLAAIRSNFHNPCVKLAGKLLLQEAFLAFIVILTHDVSMQFASYMVDLFGIPIAIEMLRLLLTVDCNVDENQGYFYYFAGLAGLFFCFKMTNVVFLAPLLLAFLIKNHKGLRVLLFFQCFCLAMIPVGVYLIYNYSATGNPVFPYFNSLFDSPYFPAENFKDTRWGPDNLKDFLLWPVYMIFNPTYRQSEISNLWPYGLVGGFFASAYMLIRQLIGRRNKEDNMLSLCIVALVSFFLWASTTGHIRYFILGYIFYGILLIDFTVTVMTEHKYGRSAIAVLLIGVLSVGPWIYLGADFAGREWSWRVPSTDTLQLNAAELFKDKHFCTEEQKQNIDAFLLNSGAYGSIVYQINDAVPILYNTYIHNRLSGEEQSKSLDKISEYLSNGYGVYDYHPSYDDFDSHLQKLDEYGIRLVGMEWLDGCLLDRDNGMLLKLGQLEEGETNTWCYASDETRNRIQIRPINSEISISFDAAFVKSFGWLKQAIAEPFLQVVFRNENGELFTDQIAVEENGSYPMHYQLKVPEGTENIDVQFNIVDGNGNVQTNIAPYQMAVVVTQIAGCSISE